MLVNKNINVIIRIFRFFRLNYGSKFAVIHQGKEAIEEEQAAWLTELKNLDIDDIAKALNVIKNFYPVSPPGAEDFKKLVKRVKSNKPGHLSNKLWQPEPVEKCPSVIGNTALIQIRKGLESE